MYVGGIRPIVTDGLCGLSATIVSLAKRLNRSRCRLQGYGLWLAQGALLDRGPDPHAKGQFSLGKGAAHCKV